MSLVNQSQNHPPARIIIFIDVGYIREWIKDCKIPLEKFNFARFAKFASKRAIRDLKYSQIIRSYFYDGLVEPKVVGYNKQKKFFDYIENEYNSFEVRLGRLIKDGKGTFRQKGVDVLMAIDMIEKANTNQYDICILVAGDLDHLEAINVVKNKGKVIYGLYISGHISSALKRSYDNCSPLPSTKGKKSDFHVDNYLAESNYQ